MDHDYAGLLVRTRRLSSVTAAFSVSGNSDMFRRNDDTSRVVAQSDAVAAGHPPRDGRFLEKLGQYNPHREEVLSDIKVEEIKAWIGKGAQLSDTVRTLFNKNGVKLA